MTAVVPLPRSQRTDAAAAPYQPSAMSRIVADDALGAVAERAVAVLRGATGRTFEVSATAGAGPDIALSLEPGRPAESYRLAAGAHGVRIAGADEAGVFYGVQTLAQLLRESDGRWGVTATEIDDAPRFGYRGVMLDVARHFFPVSVVEAFVDRAAALKLNVLHLHLSDDQGWRIQLDSRPRLTELASGTAVGGDPGGFYTKADYARLVAYAAARHMTIVPEIDGPGHTHAVGVAYPELAEEPVISADAQATIDAFGGGAPVAGAPYEGMAVGFSSLRIGDEATYAFLADVYGELAELTPGPYLHVGGDEALGTSAEDFATYVSRTTHIVAALGKTPIAWHEAGRVAGIAPETVGQYWELLSPRGDGEDDARAFVARGSTVILSPADAVYLDMKPDAASPIGVTWANGPTSVERSYCWEPATLIDGIGDDEVLGVEAPLWTETVRTLDDIDTLAFPRIASAAEIAWSPRGGPRRTWHDFRERVGALGPLWDRAGIRVTRSGEIPWSER